MYRPKESVITGLCLVGVGSVAVLVVRLADSVFSVQGYVLGMDAVGYSAIFVGVMIIIVAVASHLFGPRPQNGREAPRP